MKKIIGYIQIACCCLLLCTSCIKDGMDDNCNSYIRFVYDYNLEYVDLFHKQATKVNLYVFDEDGRFVTELKDESGSFEPGYLMPLPISMRGQKYTIVAWSGLYDDSYDHTPLTPGVSTLEDLEVAVNNLKANNTVDRELQPLWHGKLTEMEPQFNNDVATVSLVKNTNKFRVVMKRSDSNEPIDVDDYSFQIVSPNGRYDHENSLLSNAVTEKVTYTPYYTANDSKTGAIAEMNSLRLVTDKDTRLVITHKGNNNPVLDIPLNDYLEALRLDQYSDMPLQEYMDRCDNYGIVLFFTGLDDEGNYISVDIQINGWMIREQVVG